MRGFLAALCAVVAAAFGLGIGEVVAALVRPASSPVVVVANRFILATPEWLKQWAIKQFGTGDKTALGTGIFVAVGVFAAGVGLLGRHRRWAGIAGMLAFGAIGVYCALTTHAHHGTDVIPVLFAAGAAAAALDMLLRLLDGAPARVSAESTAATGTQRRTLLAAGAGSAALAALAGFGGRRWQHHRFDAAKSREAVVIPAPVQPVKPLPRATDLAKSPIPFVTSNKDFYRIDTAYSVPQVNPDTWQLKIHGMVDKPIAYTLKDLLAMPLIERLITMMCVSNEVGGDLIGTALFRGVRLAPLLKAAGLNPKADQLVCRSVDGMTIGAPVAQVMDGRDALLAVAMNGSALPVVHGFPVRMVVPGLYGYVSACKWITEIEVTTFAAYDAYWVQRGWLAQLPIQLGSRIDAPTRSKKLKVGTTVPIAGVAWHQHVGVGRVQVQIDDGEWTDARLGPAVSKDTWRQWVLPWTVGAAGMHRITVRAYDGDGTAQDTKLRDPYPGAASGLHSIAVQASS